MGRLAPRAQAGTSSTKDDDAALGREHAAGPYEIFRTRREQRLPAHVSGAGVDGRASMALTYAVVGRFRA